MRQAGACALRRPVRRQLLSRSTHPQIACSPIRFSSTMPFRSPEQRMDFYIALPTSARSARPQVWAHFTARNSSYVFGHTHLPDEHAPMLHFKLAITGSPTRS